MAMIRDKISKNWWSQMSSKILQLFFGWYEECFVCFYFLEVVNDCIAGLLKWKCFCVNVGGFGVVHVKESPLKG